jgi:hypothetical protein
MEIFEQNQGKLSGLTRANNPLPQIVQQIQARASGSLAQHIDALFSSCDDFYFKLAEKAPSNNEQNMYFESMREIRLKKESVQARFNQHLIEKFLRLGLANPAGSEQRGNLEDLSLVQTEELEKSVAITSMVSKARIDCQEQLYHLNRRFDFVIHHASITEQNNPLDPGQIGDAFAKATNILDLEVKARIVLFKQFELLVMSKLPQLLDSANQQFVDAGVLPKVDHQIQRHELSNSTENTGAAPAPAPAADPAQTFQHKFNELSQLLSSVRDIAAAGQLGFPLFVSDGSGPEIPQRELNGILSELQHKHSIRLSGTTLLEPQIDIRTLLHEVLRKRKTSGKSTRVSKSDEDVINLVAMFFDFVLDDKQLPIHVQALVSRLQIPVLKVALKDRSFFSKATHPVRKLINEIVAAGIGMLESETESRNALFKKMSGIVHDIHDNYSEDEGVFERTLKELQEYRQREEGKAARIEKRTSETAEASAKTQHTKEMIKEMVLERLCDIKAPLVIQTFLIEDWQQVLFLARVKHGNESSEWLEVVQTMDDLIWTALEHKDEKSQLRLKRIIPDLQQRLKRWLATAKPSAEAIEEALAPVLTLQQDLLRSNNDSVNRAVLNSQQQKVLKPDEAYEKPWKEMTAVERQQVQYQALTYDYIKKAEDRPLGIWVLFTKTADGSSLRCKLAAKIDTNDHYIFVNRLGFKVMEKKRKEFALNLQQGKAKLLDSNNFFDRMMHKVTDRLQTASVAPST